MKFESKNDIKYFQDMRFYKNLPIDIDFKITKKIKDGSYEIVAYGYGDKENYGNGSIFVYGLTESQIKLFEGELISCGKRKKT